MDPNSSQYLPGMAYVHNLDAQLHEWEYEEPEPIIQVGGAVRLVGRVLIALGSGLSWLGGRLKHSQVFPGEASLRHYESREASR